MCYEYNKLEWEELDQKQRTEEKGDVAAEPEVQPTNIPGHNQEPKREQEPAILLERERLLLSLR